MGGKCFQIQRNKLLYKIVVEDHESEEKKTKWIRGEEKTRRTKTRRKKTRYKWRAGGDEWPRVPAFSPASPCSLFPFISLLRRRLSFAYMFIYLYLYLFWYCFCFILLVQHLLFFAANAPFSAAVGIVCICYSRCRLQNDFARELLSSLHSTCL